MTEQQAIKRIKNEIGWESEELNREAFEMGIKALEEVQQYRAFGTVEELKEANEKQIAKKPFKDKDNYHIWTCPNCKKEIYWDTDYGQQKFKNCTECGQKLLWD